MTKIVVYVEALIKKGSMYLISTSMFIDMKHNNEYVNTNDRLVVDLLYPSNNGRKIVSLKY